VIYLLNIASKDKREQVLKHLHTTNQLLQKAAATLEGDGFCNLNGHVIAFEIRQRGIRLLKLNLAPNMPQILDVCVKAATRFAKSANGYCSFSYPLLFAVNTKAIYSTITENLHAFCLLELSMSRDHIRQTGADYGEPMYYNFLDWLYCCCSVLKKVRTPSDAPRETLSLTCFLQSNKELPTILAGSLPNGFDKSLAHDLDRLAYSVLTCLHLLILSEPTESAYLSTFELWCLLKRFFFF